MTDTWAPFLDASVLVCRLLVNDDKSDTNVHNPSTSYQLHKEASLQPGKARGSEQQLERYTPGQSQKQMTHLSLVLESFSKAWKRLNRTGKLRKCAPTRTGQKEIFWLRTLSEEEFSPVRTCGKSSRQSSPSSQTPNRGTATIAQKLVTR